MAFTNTHGFIALAVVLCIVLPILFSSYSTVEPPQPPARETIRNFASLEQKYKARLAETVTPEKLQAVLTANTNYKQKTPFPHTYYDGLFPMDVLQAVAKEIPDAPHMKSSGCVDGSQKCYNSALQKRKNAYDEEKYFGPATLTLFQTLKSAQFTAFLEKLTGIEGLIPDPEYRGSGVHQTLPGGYLNIHADFNR